MSIQACANIVHQADPARWRAVMSAPVASRDRMLPIYAANIEISRAPWVTKEPFIALMRLQWWRDALAEIRDSDPRRHEVVDALKDLPAAAVSSLDVAIDARQFDVDKDPFQNPDDLLGYARDTTYGAMAGTYLALGGYAVGLPQVMALATALGTARVLQAYVDLNASGWRCLPADWAEDQTVEVADKALIQWDTAQPLFASKTPATAAVIEAAGAGRFLHYIAKHPASVTAGDVPSFATRNALSRAKVAWGIKPYSPVDAG